MKAFRILIVAGALALPAPVLADGVPHDAKFNLAVRLLHDSGTSDTIAANIESGIDASIAEQKKANPEISDAFWAEFKTEFSAYVKAHNEELLDLIAEVYARHFSEAELQQAVDYTENGMGKKLADPKIEEEVGKSGEEWGEKVGALISDQVVAKLKGPAGK